MMLFRRRTPYSQYPVAGAPARAVQPSGVGPGYGPGYGPTPMGGGMGSGIAGGLASGLAVGAGVVAGEELAHHFLDGGQHPNGGVIPSADAAEPGYSNSDMGGNDFGANDPGSWDDGGGGLAVAAAETTGVSARFDGRAMTGARSGPRPLKNSPFGRLSRRPFYSMPRHCRSHGVVQGLHSERNVLHHAVKKKGRRGANVAQTAAGNVFAHLLQVNVIVHLRHIARHVQVQFFAHSAADPRPSNAPDCEQ